MQKLLLILILTSLLTACSIIKEEDAFFSKHKLESTRFLMGTQVTITTYDPDQANAMIAINASFDEIERIDKLLSNFVETSEVSQLNKNSQIKNISEDFFIILKRSFKYSDYSNGAFDITVQPILDLYTHTFKNLNRSPTEEEIKNTLELVDYEKIHLDYRDVDFRKQGMKITLGGIAKGYATDKAMEVLQSYKIKHALVNAGGDLKAIGKKPNGDWKIALQNPRNPNQFITIIPITNKAVVTSGDYERYFDEDQKFHHIINPNTGYSADELISVTIIADDAIDADAISTAVFVLGPEEGLEMIEKLEGIEGLLITKEKEIIRSSGFQY